ncbi:uncharacterized protein LOC132902523 [Amyelois transitella]|uniref:uncharacterized protein LOC132902523 n=1 Tax=Amyelois transitella TaxID=680683 RepID=UPI0029906256|nr:uncharacterized protein LOC132902523 [Amyelois transitella]
MPPIKGKMLSYSEEDMMKAYSDVKSGMSISAASKKYSIPYSTLSYKVNGKTPLERRMGPVSYLSAEQEDIIVLWILEMAKAGFPVTVQQLQDSVCKLVTELNIETPFKNNRPGRHWYESFKKRHPEIRLRTSQNLTEPRAAVTYEALRKWFAEISEFFKEKNLEAVIKNPKRVFNCDETAFFLNPKGNKVLAGRGNKTVYQKVNADEKECLTVLLTGNAAGDVPPPMIVYQYARIPRDLALSVPKNWGVGRSENGWMTGETFFEFISNIFNPWLNENNIEKPAILFIDGHTSHLTLQTSKFCSENGIILVALYPNATHLIQPMDVSVFRTLKSAWKTGVQNWRLQNIDSPRLRKVHFAPLLEQVLENTLKKSLFENGFRKCGLCPWNLEAVLQPTSKNNNTLKEDQKKSLKELREGLVFIEKHIGQDKLKVFQNTEKWTEDVQDQSLFQFWKDIKNKHDKLVQTMSSNNDEIVILPDEHENLTDDNNKENSIISGLTLEVLGDSERILTPSIETRNFLNASEVSEVFNNLNVPAKLTPTTIICDKEKDHITEILVNPQSPGLKSPVIQSPLSLNPTQPTSSSSTAKPIIPTPFKNSLFWPKEKENNKKKRNTEKVPAVVTSEKWQEYHENKERKKLEQLEQKQKRAEERKRKKQEKEEAIKNKKNKGCKKKTKTNVSASLKKVTKSLFASSSESECGTWKPSGGSTDDLNSDDHDTEFNIF